MTYFSFPQRLSALKKVLLFFLLVLWVNPVMAKPLKRIILDDESFLLGSSRGSLLSLNKPNERLFYNDFRQTVRQLSRTARSINPNFGILLLNGLNLVFRTTGAYDSEPKLNTQFLGSIDGLILEGYKYSTFQYLKLRPDTIADAMYMKRRKVLLNKYASSVLPLFWVDYTSDPNRRRKSISSAYKEGNKGIAFSTSKQPLKQALLEVPSFYNQTTKTIVSAAQANNFFFFPRFSYDSALKSEATLRLHDNNFDLIVIPPFYKGQPFSARDINMIKHKKSGFVRLVYAYVNIAEASPNMYYWKQEWNQTLPSLILRSANPNGLYFADLASDEWRKILYQGKKSFLYTLIKQGFDGIVIDGAGAADYLRAVKHGSIYSED